MLNTSLNELTQNLGQWVTQVSVNALSSFSGYVAEIPGIVAKTIVTVVATFFFSMDYEKIVGVMEGLLPEEWRNYYKKIKSTV